MDVNYPSQSFELLEATLAVVNWTRSAVFAVCSESQARIRRSPSENTGLPRSGPCTPHNSQH